MSVIKDILDWFSRAAKKVTGWLTFGKDVANTIKDLADNPLLDIAVGLTATKLDDLALKFVRKELSDFITAVGWAELKVSELEGDAKAVVLNAVSAVAAKAISTIQNGDLNIQTALTGAQYVYDSKQIKV